MKPLSVALRQSLRHAFLGRVQRADAHLEICQCWPRTANSDSSHRRNRKTGDEWLPRSNVRRESRVHQHRTTGRGWKPSIVIFTDGLADAQTPSGEEFGDERVIDCCRGLARALSAEQLVERLPQAAARRLALSISMIRLSWLLLSSTVTAGVRGGRFFLVVRSSPLREPVAQFWFNS